VVGALDSGKAGVLCANLAIQRPDRARFPGYFAR
jgi:hypothetical protein